MNDYYVYAHIKEDDPDGIFYIGKGRGRRAWCIKGRNKHWRNIFQKHGRRVVLFEQLSREHEAFCLEVALITLYREAGYLLTNACDGGEGAAKHAHVANRKTQIMDFWSRSGRIPRPHVREEKQLGDSVTRFCSPSTNMYDKEFHEWCKIHGYGKRSGGRAKQQIMQFFEKFHRLPAEKERKPYRQLMHHCVTTSKGYDPVFRQWCVDRGYGKPRQACLDVSPSDEVSSNEGMYKEM